jgi:UDPglucose 6-dehydrogenase
MKIGIIGLGVVGSACEYGFKKLGHEVLQHDLKLGTKINDVLGSRICYICVPTPSKGDGSCDTSIVDEVVEELKQNDYNGVVAIKSTVKPGTTEKLIEKTKLNLCFVPEFLRERSASSDFVENHDLLAIGTHSKDNFNLIKDSHGKYPEQVVMLKPVEAEMLKYYSNVFNALRITFANEFYEVCKTLGADYTKVKDAFVLRKTTTDMYLDVNDNFRGYGGVCLPKDTAAMAALVKELNLDMNLFGAIEEENKKFKTTVFEGMRLR